MKLLRYYIPLLPILLFYIVVISVMGSPEPEGDGIRYFASAEHYLQGHLDNPERPNLRNGPIYPLLLVPVVGLGLPTWFAYFINVLLLFGAAIYIRELVKNWLNPFWTLVVTYGVVLYPPLILEVPRVAYESLTVFLVVAYLFHAFMVFQPESTKKHPWLASVFLALLALTKLIFPYVILVLIATSTFFFFLKKSDATKRLLIGHIVSYLLLMPYLFLTFQLTGKVFYWANSGGEIMYWKTSPYEEEFGDWFQPAVVRDQGKVNDLDSCGLEKLFDRHSSYFEEIDDLTPIEMNEALSKKASEQRKAHPEAFIKNSVASLSRLFFNFPFSYTNQKLTTLGFVLLNMFVLVLSFFGLIIVAMRLREIPTYFWIILVFAMVYIGGMTLLNGRVRHLVPILPIIAVFLSYVFSQLIEIRWKKPETSN
ncbi:MAG: hypothetical protein MRZ79_14535 [Bacteroidia bacterium]|nr:hypothetical protein [Bacteroidia bacterium]